MASQGGKWREDQILIVCPGSRTTMAQIGCSELTPPAHRFPTRMFEVNDGDGDGGGGDFRPYRTYRRRKGGAPTTATTTGQGVVNGEGGANGKDGKGMANGDDDGGEWEWVEDQDDTTDAIYPLQGGRIVHMEAFLAFLEHVHSMLTTTYHNTPIMLMASPQWTRPDCETIARYVFEKTKTPSLCLINSALATQYGLKWGNLTVVDIGFEKVDVTCIFDSRIVNHVHLGYPNTDGAVSGGDALTRRLLGLLEKKSFTYDMAEQLKKSHICEVLPYVPDNPRLMDLPEETKEAAPAAAVAVEKEKESPKQPRIVEPARTATVLDGVAPTALPVAGADDEVEAGAPGTIDNDGVLDVASIVASGQTKEFLAKKEKEKSEKQGQGKGRGRRAAGDKGGADADAQAAKPLRLPNSKRTYNVFHYEEVIEVEVVPQPPPAPKPVAAAAPAAPAAPAEEEKKNTAESAEVAMTDAAPAPVAETAEGQAPQPAEKKEEEAPKSGEEKLAEAAEAEAVGGGEPKPAAETANGEAIPAPLPEPSKLLDDPPTINTLTLTDPSEPPASALVAVPAPPPVPERQLKRVRRDIEVGLERFTFAERIEIDRIVTSIYRAVQGIDDMYMRPACWDNIVFVGNGSRMRGLRDNIMQTLQARHLVSPSTATMFASELPSNMATPSGTGSQTPTGAFTNPPHQLGPSGGSGVNPLLQAATTASLGIPSAIANRDRVVAGDAGTPGPSGPGSNAGDGVTSAANAAAAAAAAAQGGHSTHFHSQTPTSIKLAPLPTYLGEWTKNGFEEAMFLGAQVAARLAFCVHNLDQAGVEAQRLMSLSRVDYNDVGPKAIRTHSMLG